MQLETNPVRSPKSDNRKERASEATFIIVLNIEADIPLKKSPSSIPDLHGAHLIATPKPECFAPPLFHLVECHKTASCICCAILQSCHVIKTPRPSVFSSSTILPNLQAAGLDGAATMSFGVSVGDLVAIVKLANGVRERFEDAPAQYQALKQG